MPVGRSHKGEHGVSGIGQVVREAPLPFQQGQVLNALDVSRPLPERLLVLLRSIQDSVDGDEAASCTMGCPSQASRIGHRRGGDPASRASVATEAWRETQQRPEILRL